MPLTYLHTMVRVKDLDASIAFFKLLVGVTINRPPRDGHMAFVRSPDNVSVELLQAGDNLPPAEPWASMGNTGHW